MSSYTELKEGKSKDPENCETSKPFRAIPQFDHLNMSPTPVFTIALTEALTNRGVLTEIRARVRAEVFDVIDGQVHPLTDIAALSVIHVLLSRFSRVRILKAL